VQQVNLYQPILRKQQKVFSATTLLQGNLLVVLGLFALYGFSLWQSQQIESQLKTVKQQREEQSRQLTSLSATYPVRKKDDGIEQRIEKARLILQHKQRLLAAVGELGLDGENGFSHHLAGLARQDEPQLWLSRITLQQGSGVLLSGSALQSDEVARYLQRLATEPSFSGTTFRSVVINRNDERHDLVDFNLSTIAPTKRRGG